MLNLNVRFTELPADCLTTPLPNGKYDVWMRKGIGAEIKTDDNGDTYTEYHAEEEAYAQFDAPLDVLPGDPGYEAAYRAAVAWMPGQHEDEKPGELEVLRQRVDQLTAANDMLTECVLEMSAIIYV